MNVPQPRLPGGTGIHDTSVTRVALARETATRRRDQGMSAAARRNRDLILGGMVEAIDAARRSPDRTVTSDDLGDDLMSRREAGGKWMGPVFLALQREGLLRHTGATVLSSRRTRNRTRIGVWALDVDDASAAEAVARFARELEAVRAANNVTDSCSSNTSEVTPVGVGEV